MSPGAPLLCDINTQHGQRQTHVVTTSVNDEMVEAASDFINKWEDDGKTRDNKKCGNNDNARTTAHILYGITKKWCDREWLRTFDEEIEQTHVRVHMYYNSAFSHYMGP
ncbi:hypothetical protein F2P81_012331 [Scophthalmus maximus]|uniref:Uncharacterized protein n=1 Tax=Scophthalmus maximus TaxID=52904 RepID=A0A6A4SK91_SCOMX|nr:hypothetical protein F2P81_012331 [Scophthalmus maximus]